MVVRPTTKFISAGYVVICLVIVTIVVLTIQMGWPGWIPWASVALVLWPAKSHLENRLTQMTILDDKLRYETGFLSKTTRTILISRIQDITVSQSLSQRLAGIGDLSIETAGESSRLTIPGIDRPQEIADHINDLSKAPIPKVIS